MKKVYFRGNHGGLNVFQRIGIFSPVKHKVSLNQCFHKNSHTFNYKQVNKYLKAMNLKYEIIETR